MRIIQGEKLEDILATTTVEGVPTAEVAIHFGQLCGLQDELPIFTAVAGILAGKSGVSLLAHQSNTPTPQHRNIPTAHRPIDPSARSANAPMPHRPDTPPPCAGTMKPDEAQQFLMGRPLGSE